MFPRLRGSVTGLSCFTVRVTLETTLYTPVSAAEDTCPCTGGAWVFNTFFRHRMCLDMNVCRLKTRPSSSRPCCWTHGEVGGLTTAVPELCSWVQLAHVALEYFFFDADSLLWEWTEAWAPTEGTATCAVPRPSATALVLQLRQLQPGCRQPKLGF